MTKKHISIANKIKKNPWIFSTFVLAALVVVMMITGFAPISGNASADSVGEDFVEFINSRGGAQIELVSSKEFSKNLYEVTVLADGNEVAAHVTRDGKYFVQLVAPITSEPVQEEAPVESAPEVVKSDNPKVQLFVMTHCPFGTQAEKGFVPTMKALEGIADLEIRFVHYYMHTNQQEEVETPRQVCIREEQSDKFIPYLECFLGGEAGTPEEALACEKQVGIDSAKLADCIDSGRAEEYYKEDSELSEAAGVRGSPTVVINGAIAQVGRSSQAYLDAACSAFNNVPEACGAISVSSANPSAGFGYGTASSATTASC